MSKNYYDILGVKKTATADELKKAYRKKAMEWHPDKHKGDTKAEAKFKEINEAYSVLGDEAKRKQYDNFGGNPEDFMRGGGGGFNADFGGFDFGGFRGGSQGNINVDDIFSQFFGGFAGSRSHDQKGQDIQSEVVVGFEEAISGSERELNVAGKRVKIKIPAGIKDSANLRVKGMGQEGIGHGEKGDLLIKIKIAAHPLYKRIGNDIYYTALVLPSTLFLGGTIDIPTVYNTHVSVKIPKLTSPSKVFKVKGKGVKTKDTLGDMYIRLDLMMPAELTKEQEKYLKALKDSGL